MVYVHWFDANWQILVSQELSVACWMANDWLLM